MSGLGIRLYTDEDVDVGLAEQLQRQGYDALSCRDAGNHNQELSDDWQLHYATSQQRAIMVYNASDFVALDAEWKGQGLEHWGIIVAEQRLYIGELIRRVRLHLDTVHPEQQYNTLLYLVR